MACRTCTLHLETCNPSIFNQFSLKQRLVTEFDEFIFYLVNGDRAAAFTIGILSAFAAVFIEDKACCKWSARFPATWVDVFSRGIKPQGMFSPCRSQLQYT